MTIYDKRNQTLDDFPWYKLKKLIIDPLKQWEKEIDSKIVRIGIGITGMPWSKVGSRPNVCAEFENGECRNNGAHGSEINVFYDETKVIVFTRQEFSEYVNERTKREQGY